MTRMTRKEFTDLVAKKLEKLSNDEHVDMETFKFDYDHLKGCINGVAKRINELKDEMMTLNWQSTKWETKNEEVNSLEIEKTKLQKLLWEMEDYL